MLVPAGRPARLQAPLQVLDARAVALDDALDVCYTVKVHLEFLELAHNLGEARNLGVGAVDDVAGPVVLHLRKHLRLLAEVANVLLDGGHEPVKVAAQRRQRRAVEHQQTLAASSTGCARAAGPGESRLALSQELDLLGRQAQLRIGDGVGRHGDAGCGRRRKEMPPDLPLTGKPAPAACALLCAATTQPNSAARCCFCCRLTQWEEMQMTVLTDGSSSDRECGWRRRLEESRYAAG